jgi:Zn-dependent protease
LIAVTFHEAAHGWVASKLGDPTAKLMGRVTFNPFKHIDLFGTVILPVALLVMSGGKYMFGFAKPVPVNFHNLNSPRRDMVLVAFAGPGANLLIATVAALALSWIGLTFVDMPDVFGHLLFMNLYIMMKINIILAVFNLMPVPPLDGGRIAVGLLPHPWSDYLARLEHAGFLIIIFALFILPLIGDMLGMNLNVLLYVVGIPSDFLSDTILSLTGADQVLDSPLFRWWASR